MAQIVENWSDLRGQVAAVDAATEAPAHVRLALDVDAVHNVGEFPNLLHDAAGRQLTILLPDSLAASLQLSPGTRLRCRVRRAGKDRIFAHPQQCAKE